MKVQQLILDENHKLVNNRDNHPNINANLVFVFGPREQLIKLEINKKLLEIFPNSLLVGCSTSGEILGTEVHDESIIVSALEFEKTLVKQAKFKLDNVDDSYEVGRKLAETLNAPDLNHLLVFSEGLNANGSALVEGIRLIIPQSVGITGGLAGDGTKFEKTVVVCGESIESNCVVGIGLYGQSLKVGYGSLGGWDIFGPERKITRSKKHILYEIDGKSALELYKNYLGEHADNLPASGLRFPLSIRTSKSETPIVRTILGINEKEKSIAFAGDVPEGCYAQLMKANFERLIDGAISAAESAKLALDNLDADFGLLISCVGRKLVLQQRIEEEIEGVKEILGNRTKLAGFYSYGEISPFSRGQPCELHNQTMTITAFKEI